MPYVIIGALVSEGLKYTRFLECLNRIVSKNVLLAVSTSIALGMISPLCTYSTLPIIKTLKNKGFPMVPSICFLVASSMINPQIFMLTWGCLGANFAVKQVLFIIIFTTIFAIVIYFIPKQWIWKSSKDDGGVDKDNGGVDKDDGGLEKDQEIGEEKNQIGVSSHKSSKEQFSVKNYFYEVAKTLEFIGFYIVIGILAGNIIENIIPNSFMLWLFKPNSQLEILLASVISVPLYVCGGGALPLVKSLMQTGMSSGAALAFLTVGAATRISILIALASIFRNIFIVLYVIVLITFSLIAGCMV